MSDDLFRDRAIGSFIGLAIGDALGTTVEFKDRDTFPIVTDITGGGPFRLVPGQWTDDTSMAVCLAESLITYPTLNEIDLMTRFLDWYENGTNSPTGRCFDIGNATVSALLRFKFSKNPIAGSTDFFNAGNGSIMRLSPLVVRWWKNFSIYQDIAIRQSKTTHASPECLESCILLARIIASAIEGKGKNALDSGIGNAIDSILSLKAKKVISIANGDYKSFSREFIKSSGYVIDTLEAACWCVFTSDDFESAVLKAVNLGDDADTVGAVTGQIAGAVWGYSSIPDNWVKILYDHDRLHAIAEILYEAGE